MNTNRPIINCDADPFLPKGWKVERHRKGGQLEWNSTQFKLYLSNNQLDGKVIKGSKLREELEDQPVMNANVMDYLLKNTDFIPEECKRKYIFFWGTIYRLCDDELCVRCLCLFGGEWRWDCFLLRYVFGSCSPAAVLSK